MTEEKKIIDKRKYKIFIIGVYKKINNIMTLIEYIEEDLYTTACSIWKEKKIEYINECSIVGMKCVRSDNDFKIRFLRFQGGALDSDLPNDSIFSNKTLIENTDIYSQTTNIETIENLNGEANNKDNSNINIEISDKESNTNDTLNFSIENLDEESNNKDSSNICNESINETIQNKDIPNDISLEQELLAKIKNRHITDINASDIGEILVTYWNLLQEKLNSCQDLYGYYTKERDCSLHNLESINLFNFDTPEEENQFKMDTTNDIIYYSNKRRDYQTEYTLCTSYADKFKNFDSSTIKKATLTKLKNKSKKLLDSPNLRTYTYIYSTPEEKKQIITSANKKHDKVIDFAPGILKCYNKCYTAHRKLNDDLVLNKYNIENIENIDVSDNIDDIENIENIDVSDNIDDIENIENINVLDNIDDIENINDMKNIIDTHDVSTNIVLKQGEKIPRTQGSSVTIKKLSKNSIIHFKTNLDSKYQTSTTTKDSITFINRLKP